MRNRLRHRPANSGSTFFAPACRSTLNEPRSDAHRRPHSYQRRFQSDFCALRALASIALLLDGHSASNPSSLTAATAISSFFARFARQRLPLSRSIPLRLLPLRFSVANDNLDSKPTTTPCVQTPVRVRSLPASCDLSAPILVSNLAHAANSMPLPPRPISVRLLRPTRTASIALLWFGPSASRPPRSPAVNSSLDR